MKCLLDTCTFLWLVSDSPELSETVRSIFDRMLVCQAIAGGMTILTTDSHITQYPVQTTW